MAGLLDSFFGNGFDDPKSNAVMALASGLMNKDWRGGVNGYMQTMAAAPEYESKKQLQQAQMQKMMLEAAATRAKMEQDAKKNALFMSLLGGGNPSTMAQSAGANAQLQNDPLAGLDRSAAALDYVTNDGKNMGGWVNDRTKPNWVNINGNLVNTNAQGFQGGLQGGINASSSGQVTAWQPDGKGGIVVGAPAGALDTYGAYQDILANRKPLKVYNPETGREEYQTEGNVVKAATPSLRPPPSGYNGYAGNSKASANAGIVEVLQSEINNPKTTPENKAGAMRELQRIQPSAQSGAFAAAPSLREEAQYKIVNENASKVNDVWLKSSYTPLIESKSALSGTIDSINQTRTAMNAMGGTGWGTGWGTETKATAASVLTGLGVGGKNAEMYATNAQTFQQAAMTRLQAELQNQKGGQTEGDSTRQAATYAALKNTPQANSYILDSAQAKAERDLMKAKFYESALPIASKKGDLQEIDREWAKRAPSLFSMPSMQKWVKK